MTYRKYTESQFSGRMCMKRQVITVIFFLLLIPVVSIGQQTEPVQRQASVVPEKYVVKKSDTLWDISKKFYGDPFKWPDIIEKNPDIENPHWIYPGQTIIIGLKIEKIEEPVAPPPQPLKTPESLVIKEVPKIPEIEIPEIIEEKEATVRILFTNNSNGKLKDCNCPNDPYGGLAERVSLIRSYREEYPDMLLLDSGGYFGLSGMKSRGPVVLKLMDIMGYDTLGIGDQELYHSLKWFLDLLGDRGDKIINASLYTREGNPVFKSHRILTMCGVRFGILGLISDETFRFFPGENKDFTVEDPDVTLKRLLPELKISSDYVIVLSQMGREKDEEIAHKWPGIDLIIGGHSQTLLEKAIQISNCRIVQAGRNGGRVGEIVLTFEPSKKLKNFSYNLIDVLNQYTIPSDIKPLVEKTSKVGRKG